MTSSPSLHGRTGFPVGSGARTRVEMHKVDVQLQKEIDRLEKQQSAAVSNIANHQQAMKMSWRKLEQRRAAPSPLLSRSKETTPISPGSRRGLLHSSTNLYPTDSAPPMSTVVSPQVVTVTGDIHHKRLMGSRGPPPSASNNKHLSSAYLSSPYSLRRMNHGQKTSTLVSAKTLGDPDQVATSHIPETDSKFVLSSEPLLTPRSSTSSKDTLLKASVLMGVESSSSGPESFKNFYSSGPGIERAQSAASFLSEQKLKSDCPLQDDPITREQQSVVSADNDSELAKMFEDIKNCRYIRHYHPDGTALDEYF